MKILEVNKYYYLRRGAERHFLDLIDVLKKSGHTVAVFAMDDTRNVSRDFEKYFVSYVGYNNNDSTILERLKGIGRLFWSFEARKKMTALLTEFEPDVVHLHNIYHQLSPSILGPIKSLGIPIFMTVHDYSIISPDKDKYYPEIGKKYWKFLFIKKYSLGKRILLVLKKYWEEWMNFYGKNIDGYIVPSVYVKNILEQAGIAKEKISVMPHFIVSKENDKRVTVEQADSKKKKYAFYGGSISHEKGVDILIDIFEKLHIPLILAGTPESGFVVQESNFVTFLGRQTKEQMTSLTENATCVVSASQLPETFGLLALEANALGKPFFGFATGAFSEIIENGKNGYLAMSKEELQQYIVDFFGGKIQFDTISIIQRTQEKFGEVQYVHSIENLFSSFIKKKE